MGDNESEDVYTDRQEDGVAVFLKASYFNHSCVYMHPIAVKRHCLVSLFPAHACD